MSVEQYQGDMEMCHRCSCCKFIPLQMVEGIKHSYVCPSVTKYNLHTYSGGGRLQTGAAMGKEGYVYSDKFLDIVYNCQMCGACGVSCNYAMDMEVIQPIQEIRMKCVEDGKTHKALDNAMALLRKQGTLVPAAKAKRGDWAKGLNIKNALKDKVDVLFHVGCLGSFDPKMQKLAKATAKILQKAGVNFGIAGDDETCCGGRAYQMGYKEDFLNQAKKNMDMIKKAGIKTLVTGCADGYQAFKVLYDQYGLKGDLEVLHISEYIDQLIKSGKLKLKTKLDLQVTYHDPCRLGRMGESWIHWNGKKVPGDRFIFDPPKIYRRGSKGVYEPPRDVLKAIPGVNLTEMTRIKEYAWCCGAGGGVNESNPDFAQWTAKERIEEAISTGAEAIVTTCPWCEKMFAEAVQASGGRLKIYDIVELVEQAI